MIAHVGKSQISNYESTGSIRVSVGDHANTADQGLGQIVIQVTVSFTYVACICDIQSEEEL